MQLISVDNCQGGINIPVFHYLGRQKDGTPAEGTIEAPSRAVATARLRKEHLWLDQIDEVAQSGETTGVDGRALHWSFFYGLKPISAGGQGNLFVQLSALYRAGVPMQTVVEELSERVSNRRMAQTLKQIAPKVGTGHSLSQCMAEYPQMFSRSVTGMVRVGELTGNLDVLSKDIAGDFAQEQRIWWMLLIPKLYFSLVALLLILVPSIVMVISHGLAWWPQYALRNLLPWIGVIILVFYAFRILWHIPHFQSFRDWLAYRMPLWGLLTRRFGLARFFRAMEIAVKAGVDFPTSLNAAADAAGNGIIIRQLHEAEKRTREGMPLDQSLKACPFIPTDTLQLLNSAERGGAYDDILPRLAENSKTQREHTMNGFRVGGMAVVYVIATLLTLLVLKHGYEAIYDQYFQIYEDFISE